jgi:RNA polymerase sigma-70 factor (ECF subfamily)
MLYDRWVQRVYSLVVNLLHDTDEAEDVVEETFWQVWQRAAAYDPERGTVSTWLLTMTRSQALDRMHAKQRRRSESLADRAGAMQTIDALDPSLDAEDASRRATVLQALQELPDEQREGLELAYFGGLSQAEIAEYVAEPLDTVQTRMRLGLRKLCEQLVTLRGADESQRLATNDLLTEYDLAGVALGVADKEELVRIEAAAATNPALRNELAAMEDVVAQFSLLALRCEINRGRSAGIRSRLVSKAAASREGRTSVPRKTAELLQPWFKRPSVVGVGDTESNAEPVAVPVARHAARFDPGASGAVTRPAPAIRSTSYRRSGGSVWPWLALAGLLVIVVGGIQQWRLMHSQDELSSAVASREEAVTSRIAKLEAAVASKDSVIQSLTGLDMKVVDLVNYSSQGPLARVFWDQKTQEWTLYAYQMRQPKPGKTFQIWLVANNNSKPISAGTFQPDAHGEAVVRARYPLDRHALVKVEVSEEPAGGMPYPTGPIVVAGR